MKQIEQYPYQDKIINSPDIKAELNFQRLFKVNLNEFQSIANHIKHSNLQRKLLK